jgi:hypothetical protein
MYYRESGAAPEPMYDQAGFEEVARRKPQRPVVRLKLG